jgi:MFS family permease
MHDESLPQQTSASPLQSRADTLAPIVSAPEETLGGVYVGPPLIRRALRDSFTEGLNSNGMQALLDTFGIAAAIALKASSMGIALMSSLPMLLGSVGQFFIPAYADPAKGRKHYVLLGVSGQILFLFLAGLAGWLPGPLRAWAYVGFFVTAAVSSNMTGPFWVGWMGDLIPTSVRGRHFAWRSIFFSWSYLTVAIASGAISRRYGSSNAPWILFACVLTAAASFRSISWMLLKRQYEPISSMALEAFEPFKFRPSRDFFAYCLATGAFQGAAALSGPFFNVWYLRDLHFNYLTLSIALGMAVFGSIVFAGFWGKLSDNYGAVRVLRISGLLVVFIPIPYLFFENRYAIWLSCFYSGATWSGYNNANFGHLLNATDRQHRSHYIGFSSLVVGLIGCLFALLGGFLATRLPVLFRWQLQSLFLLSSVLRLGVLLFLFGKVREYRQALPKNGGEMYMELPGFRMGAGLVRNVLKGRRNP